MTNTDLLNYLAALSYAAAQSLLAQANAAFAKRPVPAPVPTFPAPTIGINAVIPPAGHVVHIANAMPDYYKGNDWLMTTVTDPTGNVQKQPGPNTGFLCNAPGVYMLQQTYNGVAAPPLQFTVPPASRIPATAISSNTTVKLTGKITQTVSFKGCVNVVCDVTGATIAVSGPAFDFDAVSKNITVISPHIDSPLVNGNPTGYACESHGENISFVGAPKLGNVTDGFKDNLPGATGLYFENVTEDSPTCNPGRMFFFMDSRDAVFVNCVGQGAIKESDFRTTAMMRADGKTVSDGLLRALILGGRFAQPTTGNKASLVFRKGFQILGSGIEFDLCPVSITTGGEPGVSTPTLTSSVRFDNCNLVNCKYDIEPGAQNITFCGGNWSAGDITVAGKVVGGGENFSVRKEPVGFPYPVTGIVIKADQAGVGVQAVNNNHSFCNISGILKPGDVTISDVVLTTKTPKLPFAKDANGPLAFPNNLVKAGA